MKKLLVLVVLLVFASCEKPAHVARCVEWCESKQCDFYETTILDNKRTCVCKCARAFKGEALQDNSTEWAD